jgi:prepilin-type N-terminal cleavage/methylation domain-containing protein
MSALPEGVSSTPFNSGESVLDASMGSWKRNDPPGFNVVELLIAMSIMGLIVGIGLPGIIGGIQRTGVDGAARRLAQDLRLAQAAALTRGVQARLIAFNQAGEAPRGATAAGDNCSTSVTDSTHANMYRIETRSSAGADWPPLTADTGGNSNVLTVWNKLGSDYKGVSITTGNTICFSSQGSLAYSTSTLSIVAQGPGGTKVVQTNVIGRSQIP